MLNLNQKFELRGYSVFFDIKDSLLAENLLDSLDRGTSLFKEVFNIDSDPTAKFFITNSISDMESILGKKSRSDCTSSVDLDSEKICIINEKTNENNIGKIGLKELGHLYFDKNVGEREVRMRQMRTPSWLREGFALQAALKYNTTQVKELQDGWELVKNAKINKQLIKPAMLTKDINIISDVNKKRLAVFQSFYMTSFLLDTYCDSFFAKYSTLMKAIDDMESENCFRQITSFDFEKFFTLFEAWVQKTNAWAAIE